MRLLPRLLATVLCALVAACESSMNPTSAGYAGEWSGTTAQNRPISFTISKVFSLQDRVMDITVGYDFNGCSGSETYKTMGGSLAPAECVPGWCPPRLDPSYRAFNYGCCDPQNPDDGPPAQFQLYALFTSNTRAEGKIDWRNYRGCGSATDVSWTATRR